MTPKDRLTRHSAPPNECGCILWTGSLNKQGYGAGWFGRGWPKAAHRVSYILAHGPISDGLCVCHKCDVRNCINPEHLFLGTHFDNVRDCVKKGRAVRAKGEKAALSKLTEADVREILESHESRRDLAKRFNVTPANIHYIQKRRTWRHIQVERPGPNTGAVAPNPTWRSQTKLSEDQVREIAASDETYEALAKRYNVVVSTIALIKTGHHWRHVTGLSPKAAA